MAKKRSKYKAKQKVSNRPKPQDDPKVVSEKLDEEKVSLDDAVKVESKEKDVTVVKKAKTKSTSAKKSAVKTKKRGSLGKIIREMVSELKKVDWPPFKKTQHHSGVLQKTSTVLLLVLMFTIVVVAFDSGLLALLQLLTRS